MANLTERAHELKGKTVLYIPAEDIRDVAAAAREKDLVQRLESTLIHWTRQIKVGGCTRCMLTHSSKPPGFQPSKPPGFQPLHL
jgi:hypothetical protein